MWDKELGPEPDIEWSILAHAPAYKLGQRNCDLCLTEKVEIAKNYKKKPLPEQKRGDCSEMSTQKDLPPLATPKG